MRTQPLAGHNQVAQVAAKTRVGWWKGWLLSALSWLTLTIALAQGFPDIVWRKRIHIGGVSHVVFSPDGRLILSLGSVACLWRASDGSLIRSIGGAQSVAFSPDGELIALGQSRDVRLLRASDDSVVRTLVVGGVCTSVAFSPDGNLIAAVTSDGIIKLWRISDGTEVHTLRLTDVNASSHISFSPDGRLIAAIGVKVSLDFSAISTIQLWRTSDGVEVRTITERGFFTNVSFSPDGSLLASGSLDGTVKLWRVSDGTELRVLRSRSGIRSIAFSPDGSLIVSGHDDATLRLWQVLDGKEIRTLRGHPFPVVSVVFSPDGRLIASGGGDYDRTLRIWRTSDGLEVQNYDQAIDGEVYIQFSPDGQFFGYGSGYEVTLARNPFVPSNQRPAVPTLVAPSDNATVSQTPTFRVGLSDPDGDQVKAIIEISDASGVVRTLETSLVASGSEVSVSVPAEQPLAVGSYTWRARAQDSNGNLSDWSAARALSVTDGVPIQLRGVGTFALIGAGVSSPDSLGLDGVELVRWDASAQRYSSVSQLQPGEGYFVKATTPVQTVLRGDPITGEFTLSLQPGWNLIAVPTLTAVAWDLDGVQVQRGVERKNLREAQRAGWVEDYLWGWQQIADDPMSGQYQLVYDARILPGVASRLEPFQAYWIFARESCALVLNSERGRAATVAPVSDSSAWVLQIEAVRGSGFSNSVWIGIAKGRSWHAALAPAPPQGEPPVQVRVRRQEGSFAADLRSAMDRDTRWSIEVVVAPSEQPQPITLRVNNLTRLPRGVNLALIDEQSGARRPLRLAASSLSFTAPADGGVFRFAIEPISQRALLRVLNPTVRGGSRSGEAITLGFTLTTEAQTQVQIRAGSRTVRTLSDHRTRSAGLQEFVWDGRDDSGTHLPPGAYTAEITAVGSDGQTARVAVPILIRR